MIEHYVISTEKIEGLPGEPIYKRTILRGNKKIPISRIKDEGTSEEIKKVILGHLDDFEKSEFLIFRRTPTYIGTN